MPKQSQEIRCPIHGFVRIESDEHDVLNSEPFQRLRHIHQLALTYLIYPGATHRRFEHSLGVMELAGRVFDVITNRDNVRPEVAELIPDIVDPRKLPYWRQAVRMAALCHDIGHLPFSHAAENLLPKGWNHERLTRELILSSPLKEIFANMTPPLRPLDVAKLAVGKKKAKDLRFTTWDAILAEIIVGDAFGVDRIDYLLRDSHHAGVAYGRFDHARLIDSLRVLPSPPVKADETETDEPETAEPALGIEDGGLHAAEALMLARFFMYTQVYFHKTRRIYNIHLKDFLHDWLP